LTTPRAARGKRGWAEAQELTLTHRLLCYPPQRLASHATLVQFRLSLRQTLIVPNYLMKVSVVSQSDELVCLRWSAPVHSRNAICATRFRLSSQTHSFIFSALSPAPHRPSKSSGRFGRSIRVSLSATDRDGRIRTVSMT